MADFDDSISIDGIEKILTYIKNQLNNNDNMSDKIVDINAEYNDGISLQNIRQYYYGKKSKLTIFPCIEIFPDSSPGEDFHANGIRNQHRVGVRIWDTDTNDENLTKKVYRFLKAIIEILKLDDNLLGNVDLISYDGNEYEDEITLNRKSYLWGATAFFIIDHEEVIQ